MNLQNARFSQVYFKKTRKKRTRCRIIINAGYYGKEVTRMTEQEIEKLVQDKLNEAYKENEPPKKFFLTENGRGVVDGGDMYNAVVEDVLRIVQKAMTETLKAALKK